MNIPATMRALRQYSLLGPQDTQLITDAPVPSPGRGEVLIRVAAAGVNFADVSKAHGTFLNGPQPPYLAGFEAAGEVVAVGGERPAGRGLTWSASATGRSPITWSCRRPLRCRCHPAGRPSRHWASW